MKDVAIIDTGGMELETFHDISLMAKKYNEVYQDLCPNK